VTGTLPAKAGRELAMAAPALTDEQVEAAARILATVEQDLAA
jgi:hypothetical protein